jgi:hypothetical protein
VSGRSFDPRNIESPGEGNGDLAEDTVKRMENRYKDRKKIKEKELGDRRWQTVKTQRGVISYMI